MKLIVTIMKFCFCLNQICNKNKSESAILILNEVFYHMGVFLLFMIISLSTWLARVKSPMINCIRQFAFRSVKYTLHYSKLRSPEHANYAPLL